MKKLTLSVFASIFLLISGHVWASETPPTQPVTNQNMQQGQNAPSPQKLITATPEQLQSGPMLVGSGQMIKLSQQKMSPEMQCILKRKRLDVAIYDGNVPPFFMKDDKGELVGIDITIAKALAKELGVNVSFIRVKSFNDVVQMVADGKANVGISKLSVTLERAKKVQYTGRYVDMGKALLVNRLLLKQLAPHGEATLSETFAQPGAKIGVIAKSSFVNFAYRIFPKTEVVEYPNWDSLVHEVLEGKILAAFRDEWEVRKVMSDIPDAPLKAQAIIIKDEVDPIEMIVPWNSNQLAHFIDKFIEINNFKFDVKRLTGIYKDYKKTKKFAPLIDKE